MHAPRVLLDCLTHNETHYLGSSMTSIYSPTVVLAGRRRLVMSEVPLCPLRPERALRPCRVVTRRMAPMPLTEGNTPSSRGVASAERHALHSRGACLAARRCREFRVWGFIIDQSPPQQLCMRSVIETQPRRKVLVFIKIEEKHRL